MRRNCLQSIIFIAVFAFTSSVLFAQKVNEPKVTNTSWTKAYTPFRIVGNLYYVGTADLACYLITTF